MQSPTRESKMQSPTRERDERDPDQGKEAKDKRAHHRKAASRADGAPTAAPTNLTGDLPTISSSSSSSKPQRSLSPPAVGKERERDGELRRLERRPDDAAPLSPGPGRALPPPSSSSSASAPSSSTAPASPPAPAAASQASAGALTRGDFPSIISLNVGGLIFATTWETLSVRDPNSMLARMFSGSYSCRKDTDDRYFIDRDGTHFRYILNYLRDGTFNFPSSARDELLAEARFYQLSELVSYLEGRGNHYAAHQLSGRAIDVLRNRKGHDISVLKEYLLTEFERQAAAGTLTPIVAIYSTENSKLYRDASDPDIRNIVISDLQALGFKVVCQTTLSSAYAVHVFETSLHASSLVVRNELTEKLNNITELLKSVISTDGYGGKVVKTSTRATE